MKILLVANTDWYLYRFRLNLANFLRQQGHTVLFASPGGEYAPAIQAEGYRWIEWPVGRKTTNPLTEAQALLRLAQIFRREAPHLIHLHTIKPVLYGSLAAWMTGRKTVVRSITGLGYVFLSTHWRARLLQQVVGILYRLLAHSQDGMTIFENQHDQNFFINHRFVHPQRAALIPGVGVDTTFYTPLPEPAGAPTVTLPARMLWDKGVGEFAQAAQLLKNQVAARFVLVGSADPGNPASIDPALLDAWVQEGILEWWGWQADMRAVFAASHIVVLPSYGEGLPTVLIEAAACARPLIATDVPGCQDVVQNGLNGLLAPPKNAPALAQAIAQLLADPPLRAQMGAHSRRLAEEKFSASVINAQTYHLYQRVLATTQADNASP